jgi:anti-sigma regulatory factor (Ser/Thr protein kinase)
MPADDQRTPPELTLPSGRSSVRLARERFRADAGHLPDETIEIGTLAVSELVSNAVLHVGGEVRMRVDVDRERVRVEVADRSPAAPEVRVAAPDASTGRGLHIVSTIADRWGVEPRDDGKIVWFELRAH